jgi:hypothetical protein
VCGGLSPQMQLELTIAELYNRDEYQKVLDLFAQFKLIIGFSTSGIFYNLHYYLPIMF